MLAAISSCLVLGFLLSMVAELLWVIAVVFMMFAPWFWLLHARVETRHVHAERHLAKAGVANGKVFERSFLGGPRVAWGSQNPEGEWPWRARGAEPTRKAWFPYLVRVSAQKL